MAERSTALARVKMPDAPIAKIEELRATYAELSDKVNLITPMQSPDYIPVMHSVSLRAVVISAVGNNDTYHSGAFMEKSERALNKVGLYKLLQASGGSVIETKRTDDRRDYYVASFDVEVEIPQMDGTKRRFRSSKTVDYRDGSPQIAQFTAAQLKAARQFVPELAETKALERAIRGTLALKQKYTVDELARPFVVPVLVPDLDMSDPEVKRMVTAKALGLGDTLYGPRNLPAPDAPTLIGDGRERPEPGQTIETTVVTEDEPPASAEDFGAPPAPAKEDLPEAFCCCPDSCHAEISKQIAEITIEASGSARCAKCYPWHPHFKAAAHMELGDLHLPKFPDMDGPKAAEAHKKYMESRKKGGAA